MTPTARNRDGAQSAEPQLTLKSLVRQLAKDGNGKDTIYHAFEDALQETRRAHHGEESAEEDSLLEVMDLLSGFCDPNLVLLPEGCSSSFPHRIVATRRQDAGLRA
jgi:hypothetical protein